MANRPANAGSGRGLVPAGDPSRGDTSRGDAAPSLDPIAPPPAVHHQDFPRAGTGPRPVAGHRATRATRATRTAARAKDQEEPGDTGLAWVPCLIVLAGVAAGMYIAWQGSRYVAAGTVVLGCSLLVAALARLVLPPRLADLLSARRKAFDVLAFTVLGAGVIAVALSLP